MKKLLVSIAIAFSAVVIVDVGSSSADVSVYAPVCPKASVVVAGKPVTHHDCVVNVSTTIATP